MRSSNQRVCICILYENKFNPMHLVTAHFTNGDFTFRPSQGETWFPDRNRLDFVLFRSKVLYLGLYPSTSGPDGAVNCNRGRENSGIRRPSAKPRRASYALSYVLRRGSVVAQFSGRQVFFGTTVECYNCFNFFVFYFQFHVNFELELFPSMSSFHLFLEQPISSFSVFSA
ncbi:hypothetical protein Y032_0074g831 [Ancylostoma ceylanicum]|uniref:Uncharacterized protein n=1 Tax=Ancylostoma ceylanicum TaxID=53326 RepID=A0A016TUI3_9BILA|nr:hypothetical protein Y032_0074g831 [Ancylostoma ceylanicum]